MKNRLRRIHASRNTINQLENLKWNFGEKHSPQDQERHPAGTLSKVHQYFEKEPFRQPTWYIAFPHLHKLFQRIHTHFLPAVGQNC